MTASPQPPWSAPELETVRANYAMMEREKLLALLPGRSWESIKQRARGFGVKRPRRYAAHYFWREKHRRDKFKTMYETASWPEIHAAFPQFTRTALRGAAYRLGYCRSLTLHRTNLATRADPLLRALSQARVNQGLSQRTLAKKLGISYTTMRGWEAGRYNLSYGSLKRWCRLLGVRISVAVAVSPMQQQAAVDMVKWKREHEKREQMSA